MNTALEPQHGYGMIYKIWRRRARSVWASWLCAMDQLVWWSFLARVRLRFQIHLPRRRPAAGDHARTGTSSATADRSGDGNQSDVATAAVRRRLHSSWYCARPSVFGSKSDGLDAVMLANIVRIDAALAIRVPAHAQQDAVWSRQRFQNCLLVMLGSEQTVGRSSSPSPSPSPTATANRLQSWVDLLRDCRRRGMWAPVLVVGDGALGVSEGVEGSVPRDPGAALLVPQESQCACCANEVSRPGCIGCDEEVLQLRGYRQGGRDDRRRRRATRLDYFSPEDLIETVVWIAGDDNVCGATDLGLPWRGTTDRLAWQPLPAVVLYPGTDRAPRGSHLPWRR